MLCRTPGTGLYDNLQQYKIPEATAIFDLDYFWYDPRPFFCLAKSLYPGNYQPNYVHYFVKLLYDKGLLLRMYTQNIDGLERRKLHCYILCTSLQLIGIFENFLSKSKDKAIEKHFSVALVIVLYKVVLLSV